MDQPEERARTHHIVAVTCCPTGVAHTYMSAEALAKVAILKGHTIDVEKQGSAGVRADRALGLHGRGRGQLHELRGFRVERAGGAQGGAEPFDAVDDLRELFAHLAVK